MSSSLLKNSSLDENSNSSNEGDNDDDLSDDDENEEICYDYNDSSDSDETTQTDWFIRLFKFQKEWINIEFDSFDVICCYYCIVFDLGCVNFYVFFLLKIKFCFFFIFQK